MTGSDPCRIVNVGKRRDGGLRYWCLAHRGDATAKYGVAAARCRYADVPVVMESERLVLDLAKYRGGVAVWGAVPPVYDTTTEELERGIHVHARALGKKEKSIDTSYREVSVIENGTQTTVSELDAIYFLISTVLGLTVKTIRCVYCAYPHLDKDWFSIHEHIRHLCANCGRTFRDTEPAVGNPLAHIFQRKQARVTQAPRTLNISQNDYPGGIQIWGSNPSILWTRDRAEEQGIHVHAFDEAGKRVEDDTFSDVSIDGCRIEALHVRVYMAQIALPHLAGRVLGLVCPSCNSEHHDTADSGRTPHDPHICARCGDVFRSKGRLKRTISNPMANVLERLAKNAVRQPRVHSLGLSSETP